MGKIRMIFSKGALVCSDGTIVSFDDIDPVSGSVLGELNIHTGVVPFKTVAYVPDYRGKTCSELTLADAKSRYKYEQSRGWRLANAYWEDF